MYHYPVDIYTEPEPDTDTLANLGPLTGMAGIWTSADGMDVNPKSDGPEYQPFIERYELQPIDALQESFRWSMSHLPAGPGGSEAW